ncbi:adhesion G protein-coupled receptor E3-like isoform X1 [Aquarana catesbeiana]|uniref:adhesion G protein-coupled receptor E3-like isoform X1 n=1 Tax=Aquarana catesbeiana TaxID=8400 RepID=UPI003CCA2BB8
MTSSRGQLLWGVCIAVQWFGVIGKRYLPPEAKYFEQCSTSADCPKDSTCVETNGGVYYCACNNGFINDYDRLTITYPGGHCTVICPRTATSTPCACPIGFIEEPNNQGLYICKDKCTWDADCPAGAFCRYKDCYCAPGLCNSKHATHCEDLVKLDDQCTGLNPASVAQTTPSVERKTAIHTSISPTLLITSLETSKSPQRPQKALMENICPKSGTSSPCVCGTGSIKAKNDAGLHICKDKCANDTDCPVGATCQSKNCYCKDDLCNSKSLSQCVKLLTLDEECIDITITTQRPTERTSLITSKPTTQLGLTLTSVQTTQMTPSVEMNTTAALTSRSSTLHVTSQKPSTSPQQPQTTQTGLTLTSVQTTQTTPSVEMNTTAALTSRSSTLHVTSQKPSTSPQQPQTTQTDYKGCHSQYSNELEECRKSMNQDAFCNLLRQNARLQETSCQRNDTNITVQQVAKEFTEILNHTILNNMTASELRSAVSSIVETVETSLLVTFSKHPKNQNISTPELEVHMKAAIDICSGGETSITLTVLENTMQVPCTHVSGDRDGAIFISYKGLESKLNASLLGAIGESDNKDMEEINSPIISGAITSPNIAYLEPPVVFYLKQLKVVPPSFILQCVFLDTELKTWSSRGCKTRKSDRVNNTLCACNHLSTFAVLMAPGDIQENYGLILISRIGLSVSLVCLCLSLITFILCQSIKSAHTSFLTALCGCLFLGQLLALFGLQQTGNQVLCAVIAGLLQFSFLCAFCWMSLESALLFMTVRNLQAMNYMTSQRQLFPYVCIAGFGIPVIIIIISAAMRPGSYGTENYCWLKKDLIWSFLGPVCVLITINVILLVLTFVLLKKKLASLNKNVSTLKHTRLLTFKALSQLFILGCTWIIGIFQFGSGSLVMSYIFTICNSLQGLYIFCVHCLLNHQVREEYRRGFRRFQSKKSDSEATSGSTMPMTIKSQSQASEVSNLEVKSARVVENQYEL